ncbi:helix-turn-helix transcriptional regulator [Saccharothrix algeriensis]|uniref:Transcriptional regulator with XRE-family HTH domain n=1 Tax=Saccharothrix algeriensis TaxID=173560 RepID=A0ABS2S1G5_9PSEU|nr:helix-turn-helix transcriptional regulator [Saccharothrix algeriensis]MBM7810081.1 transcriptional regulator with XRE-family HTH domain [Saccharothrix algeriensis]
MGDSRKGVAVPQSGPISEILAQLRRGRGLTQDDLAARLHAASGNTSVTREEVSRWERGKRIPGPYWRGWLGQVLDTPQHELERAAAIERAARRRH